MDTQSPYVGTSALRVLNTAETHGHRARYWEKGTPNGNFTPVIKVTVGA